MVVDHETVSHGFWRLGKVENLVTNRDEELRLEWLRKEEDQSCYNDQYSDSSHLRLTVAQGRYKIPE